MLLTPLSGCATDNDTASSAVRAGKAQRPDRVAGEYIVKLREGVADEQALRSELGQFDVSAVETVSPGFFLIRFAKDPGLESIQSALENSKIVEAVQPNQRFYSQ